MNFNNLIISSDQIECYDCNYKIGFKNRKHTDYVYFWRSNILIDDNLKFDFFSHAIGLGYSRSNPSLFYQFRFKKGITIGASIGKYFSPLYFSKNSWNGMLRVNYELKKRRSSCKIMPNF